MEERRPAPGEFYRHFKNKYYQIIGIAKHSETKEEMVVYQALYDDFGMYVRPLSMFLSEVDHIKYPVVKQKYRFEKVTPDMIGKTADTGYDAAEITNECIAPAFAEKNKDNEDSDGQPSSLLIEFLDRENYQEKLSFLNANRNKIDNDIIDAMAASLDVVVPEGDIASRFASLKSCIAAHAKYECTRLR